MKAAPEDVLRALEEANLAFEPLPWSEDALLLPEAAEALKITAPDLLSLGVIDEIVKEPKGGAHKNPKSACLAVKRSVLAQLKSLSKVPINELVDQRYAKFGAMGRFA